MATLEKANQELFRRGPDECFSEFGELFNHTVRVKQASEELWLPNNKLEITPDLLMKDKQSETERAFNSWSFSQTCRLAGVGLVD